MHAADIQDRDGGVLVMATLFGTYPFLLKLYADAGYQGRVFQNAIGRILRYINVEIVRRSDAARCFTVLPKRWIVERSIAWLNRCPLPKIGNASTETPSLSCAGPQSASCSESSVIRPKVSGQLSNASQAILLSVIATTATRLASL